MASWVPTDFEVGGEALWLARMSQFIISAVRGYGLQSGNSTMKLTVPTLREIADGTYDRVEALTTDILPEQSLDFTEPVGAV